MNESKHGYRISVKTKVVVESLVYAGFDIVCSFPRRGDFFKKLVAERYSVIRSRLLFV